MAKNLNWILVLILLLGLPAMACSLFDGDTDAATAVPAVEAPIETEVPAPETEPETMTEEATAVAEPTVANETTDNSEAAVTADEAPALSASVIKLPAAEKLPFNSFRTTINIEFSGVKADGTEVTQIMNAEFAYVSEPPANSIFFTTSGIQNDILGDGSIEMAQIGDSTYMVMSGVEGCITTMGNDMLQGNSFSDTTDVFIPDNFLQNIENATYEGEETINNIRTLHYSFDETVLDNTGNNEIEEAEGHIYTAKDGGFLVRMVMDATGNIAFFDEDVDQSGDLHIEMNLVDVDEALEITAPDDCAGDSAGGIDLFPMLDDVTEVASFTGFLSYRTDLAIDEVIAFYADALPADGWVKDENTSTIGEGSAQIYYTRNDETVDLSLYTDLEKDGTYVVLTGDSFEFQ